jgi:hypothetical protein
MNTRVDALNRVVLTLIGLLLLAAGALGIATGAGAFGKGHTALLADSTRDFARTTGWFWWAVAGGALLLALLGLVWLLDQLRSDRASRLDVTTDDRDGVTMVHSGALTDAVAQETESLRGVTGASAQIRDRHGKRLLLAVSLSDHADMGELRRALEENVVTHARQAIEDPGLPVDIEFRQGRNRSNDRGLR